MKKKKNIIITVVMIVLIAIIAIILVKINSSNVKKMCIRDRDKEGHKAQKGSVQLLSLQQGVGLC